MSKLHEYLEMAGKKKRPSQYQMYQEIIKEVATEIREAGGNEGDFKKHLKYGVDSVLSELKVNNFDIIKFFQTSVSETVKTLSDVKEEIEDELRYNAEQD